MAAVLGAQVPGLDDHEAEEDGEDDQGQDHQPGEVRAQGRGLAEVKKLRRYVVTSLLSLHRSLGDGDPGGDGPRHGQPLPDHGVKPLSRGRAPHQGDVPRQSRPPLPWPWPLCGLLTLILDLEELLDPGARVPEHLAGGAELAVLLALALGRDDPPGVSPVSAHHRDPFLTPVLMLTVIRTDGPAVAAPHRPQDPDTLTSVTAEPHEAALTSGLAVNCAGARARVETLVVTS